MKVLYLLLLAVFIVSFVSPSSSNDKKHPRDLVDTSEHATKLQKVTKAPCAFCKKENHEPYLIPKCGHPHHLLCTYKILTSTDPNAQGKCPECQYEFNYGGFLKAAITSPDMPDGIYFIPDRTDQKTICAFASYFIKEKNPVYVRNLLRQKVPFHEFPINNGHSALFVAAVLGSPEILDVLYKSGLQFAPVSDNDPSCLLIYAINVGNIANVGYLLDQGADMNFVHEKTLRAAIHEAVFMNKPEIVKLLIERKANLNLKSAKNGYPIHIAIEKGFDSILALLLKAGADVRVTNNLNQSPLASACCLNKLGAVKLLLEHGCKLETFTAEGYNLLHYAIIPGSFEVAEYLISISANIQMQDGTPFYALHRTTIAGHRKMVKYLLKIGANPYEKCDNEAFRLVLKEHPNLLGILTMNDPAIVIAILNHDKELVEAFLDAGIDPNTRIFNSTSTFLHLAIQNGLVGIAESLIKRGADIQALDSYGHPPLAYATGEWAEILKSKCAESL